MGESLLQVVKMITDHANVLSTHLYESGIAEYAHADAILKQVEKLTTLIGGNK